MFKFRIDFIFIVGVLMLTTSMSCKGLSEHKQHNNSDEMKEENPKATKIDASKEVIIRQSISGGILPLNREWVFYSNGEIRQANGTITKLTEEQLDEMLEMLQAIESEKLENVYPAPIGSADYRTLELTLNYNDSTRKIIIADSNDQVPNVLWQYWDSLQEVAKKSLDNK